MYRLIIEYLTYEKKINQFKKKNKSIEIEFYKNIGYQGMKWDDFRSEWNAWDENEG